MCIHHFIYRLDQEFPERVSTTPVHDGAPAVHAAQPPVAGAARHPGHGPAARPASRGAPRAGRPRQRPGPHPRQVPIRTLFDSRV